MNKKVATIIVTFNKLNFLVKCIDSIVEQEVKPYSIIIVDNDSTDGTFDFLKTEYNLKLKEKNLYDKDKLYNSIIKKDNKIINLFVIKKEVNTGSSGGFSKGMQYAYDTEHEFFWLMDDDGYCDRYQLKSLITAYEEYDYELINALVLDRNNPKKLAFNLAGIEKKIEIKNKIIEGAINPFNGTFVSKILVDNIGFVRNDMFIWGDENEYLLRAKSYNFDVATIVDAIHYHPTAKTTYKNVIPLDILGKIAIKPTKFLKIFIGNKLFLSKTYFGTTKFLVTFIKYAIHFSVHLDYKGLIKLYYGLIWYRNLKKNNE